MRLQPVNSNISARSELASREIEQLTVLSCIFGQIASQEYLSLQNTIGDLTPCYTHLQDS